MYKIKFGSDGWRGVIAKDFTVENVAKIATSIATWLTRKHKSPSAVIGYDTRFGGEMFLEAVAKVLAARGIRTYLPEDFVTSPMVSLGVTKLKASCGIIITSSHYPSEYNGIKIQNEIGGPLSAAELKDVETLLSTENELDLELISWNTLISQKLIQYINLETLYLKEVHDKYSIESFTLSRNKVIIDPMYGAGQRIVNRLFPKSQLLHSELNPTFKGVAPNPNLKNLNDLAAVVESKSDYLAGIAYDGDADRIAIIDHRGNYVESNHLVLLLIHYLAGYKQLKGKVIVSFPVTTKAEALCKHYGIEIERVKAGFHEISQQMSKEEVILGAEENGGLALGNHINERDAVWTGLEFMEMLYETNKSVLELIKEIYSITGEFHYKKNGYFIDEK
jgi:phosphomannomutase